MTEQIPVRPGQVWADNDRRVFIRLVRVVAVDATHATVEQVTGRDVHPDRPGRRTRIRLDRFRPTSNGYRLVHDTEETHTP